MANHCSSCASVINPGAKFCPRCGTPTGDGQLASTVATDAGVSCLSCGHINRASAKFCARCGAAASAPAQPKTPTVMRSSRSGGLRIGVVAGVVAVTAVLGGVVWWKMQPNRAESPMARQSQPSGEPIPKQPRGVVQSTPAASRSPQISTAGLGDARFGMDVAAVEAALGQKLVFSKEALAARLDTLECAYAGVTNLPGVKLRYEKGRLMTVIVDKPTVTTLSGLKVGDPESNVINKLRGDPTYRRGPNHYNNTIMEILVGKVDYVQAGNERQIQGWAAKFTAENGVITLIETGAASYVTVAEHLESCK